MAGSAVDGVWVLPTENVLEQAIMAAAITIRPKYFLILVFLGVLEI